MMDVKTLLKEIVIDEALDDETGITCVLIPKDIFTHIVEHLIPRDEEED